MTCHLDVATETASAGWPVFPCHPDKKPATKRGFHDATLDPDHINRWWASHPDHLVGTPTQGLVVIDLDNRADAPCTWAWWQHTAHTHDWDILANLVVATPSDGVHVYFAHPDGGGIHNSAGKLAPNVDIRADGGYVIAPGSTLPDSRGYEIIHLPDDGLPDAPPWLLTMCAATPARAIAPGVAPVAHGGTRYGLGALEAELGRLAVAGEGTRNDTLVRAAYRAGQLVAGGELDAHHAIDLLRSVAARIGLDDTEIDATIASGMRSGAQSPRKKAS